MEKKIDDTIFSDLVETAKSSSEDAEAGSPLTNGASEKFFDALKQNLAKAANAAEAAALKAKMNFRAIKNDKHKVGANLSVASAVNWLADAFRDVIDRINDHGEILSVVVTQLSKMMETEDFREEQNRKHDILVDKFNSVEKKCDEMVDFEKRTTDLETKTTDIDLKTTDLNVKTTDLDVRTSDLVKKTTDLEEKTADVVKKTTDLEDNLHKKCQDLETKYDKLDSVV